MPRTLLTLLFLALPFALSADIRLTDDQGRPLHLEAPAERIVSLVPHATELLYAIGAEHRLVATIERADYPEAARELPRVGSHSTLNVEAIVDLRPDLVIAYPSAPYSQQVRRLNDLGLAVFYSDPQSFAGIARSLRDFGRLTGAERAAAEAATAFEDEIAQLQQRYGHRKPLSVFYEVWHEPLYTLNGESYISSVIELCGGRNVFAHLPVVSPQVSLEAVFAADPQVIVTSAGDAGEHSPWRQWSGLRAVANDALIAVDDDSLHRPTPGLIQGARRLCEDLDRLRRQRYR